MANTKIVLIGGGSYGWGPSVVGNILSNEFLDGSEVALHDIDADALELVYRLALRYTEATGAATRFERTTVLAEALDGADYVVVTISTGALEAMRADLEIPETYGICQTVGDTVGPGGALRTLRNVPVFLHLGQAMERYCPQAWMLNCSNPLSTLTRVVNRETGIRAIGLCHGVRGQVSFFARFFDKQLEDCAYVNTGIDHCAWLTELVIDGRRVEDLLLEMGIDAWLALPPEQAERDEVFGALYPSRCGLGLWRLLGALPGIGDRHLVEFFPGFLHSEKNVNRYGLKRTSIDDRQHGRTRARQRLEERLAQSELPNPEGSSDNVAGWIAALAGGPPIEDNLNVANVGQIPELPLGAVVETRGILDGTGYRPIASPMAAALEAVVRPHVLRQEMLVSAALDGSFAAALAALSSDPLLVHPDQAHPMLKEMVAATSQWLPQFC
jgi:alpha-galactosidase